MAAVLVPSQRYNVNPVRPGREQPQRWMRVPGCGWHGPPPNVRCRKPWLGRIRRCRSFCAAHVPASTLRCSKALCLVFGQARAFSRLGGRCAASPGVPESCVAGLSALLMYPRVRCAARKPCALSSAKPGLFRVWGGGVQKAPACPNPALSVFLRCSRTREYAALLESPAPCLRLGQGFFAFGWAVCRKPGLARIRRCRSFCAAHVPREYAALLESPAPCLRPSQGFFLFGAANRCV